MTPLSIRYALMLFLAIGLSRQSPAQSKHVNLEIAYSQGGFYTHRSLRAPLTQPMRGLDLNVCRPTDGARRWQQLHGYPDMALQLRVRDMGNPQVYGYVISVIPYLQFYPLRRPSWRLAIAHGTGLCYITRQYSVQNLANQLISSHLNVATFLRGSIYLGRLRWQAALNVELAHESNGNFKNGNRGFNTCSIGAAVRHNLGTSDLSRRPILPLTAPLRRWFGAIQVSCGLHNYDPENKTLKATPEIWAAGVWQHNERFRTCAGLGYGLNIWPDSPPMVFVLVEEEVLLGALGIRYGLGTYLNDAGRRHKAIGKIGMVYYPFQHSKPTARGFYIGTVLKAHGSVAVHVEIRSGFVF